MVHEYWEEQWDRTAREKTGTQCISGWGGDFPIEDMLHAINRVAGILDIRGADRLLDLGCGAGLFEMAYARWVKEIYGLDFSWEMVRVARRNCSPYGNVLIVRGDILYLPFGDASFRRILANSVIQYLDDREMVMKSLRELLRVAERGAKVLISLVPDADTKSSFLEGYDRLGLSPEESRRKKEAHEHVLWFRKPELVSMIKDAGAASVELLMPLNEFHRKYYFDLLVTKGR